MKGESRFLGQIQLGEVNHPFTVREPTVMWNLQFIVLYLFTVSAFCAFHYNIMYRLTFHNNSTHLWPYLLIPPDVDWHSVKLWHSRSHHGSPIMQCEWSQQNFGRFGHNAHWLTWREPRSDSYPDSSSAVAPPPRPRTYTESS
jgi:hypothetical protein